MNHQDAKFASSHYKLWFAIAVLVVLAFALRIYRLDAVDLRGDEAFTAIRWTYTPFSSEWLSLIRSEPNPGALILYWAWTSLVGKSEFALRMLPVLSSVLGLAVIVALAKRLLHEWQLALLVGFLWTINPFLIWHAQDARQYSLVAGLSALNFYLLLRAVDTKKDRVWLLYAIAQTATLYVYYLDLLWIVPQGIYILLLRDRSVLRRAVMTWIGIAIAVIPLAVQIYYVLVVSSYRPTAETAALDGLFTTFVPSLLFGDNTIPLGAGILLVGVLVGGLVMQYRQRPREMLLILLWLIVPIVLFYLLSTRASLFRPRYVIALIPPLLLGIGALFTSPPNPLSIRWRGGAKRIDWRTSTGLIAVALVFGMISAVEIRDYYFFDTPKAADWRGLTGYLRDRTTPQDAVIFPYSDPAIEYYFTGPGELLYAPDESGDALDYLPGVLESHTAVYLLAGAGTDDELAYLQESAQYIPGESQHNVSQFRRWQVDVSEIDVPLDVDFGGVARLHGYTLLQGIDGGATLMLYWEALSQTEVDYSVLLHIAADEQAPPIAVLDHGVASAQISTRTWQQSVIYRDPIAFPADLPAGTYTIFTGMYAAQESLPPGRYAIGNLPIGER